MSDCTPSCTAFLPPVTTTCPASGGGDPFWIPAWGPGDEPVPGAWRPGKPGGPAGATQSTIRAAEAQPWYKNSCIMSALGKGALTVGIDALGLIPEGGGVSRIVGHQFGYRGIVADRIGKNFLEAADRSTGFLATAGGLAHTVDAESLIDGGLYVAGWFPGLGQGAAIASILFHGYTTIKAVRECD